MGASAIIGLFNFPQKPEVITKLYYSQLNFAFRATLHSSGHGSRVFARESENEASVKTLAGSLNGEEGKVRLAES